MLPSFSGHFSLEVVHILHHSVRFKPGTRTHIWIGSPPHGTYLRDARCPAVLHARNQATLLVFIFVFLMGKSVCLRLTHVSLSHQSQNYQISHFMNRLQSKLKAEDSKAVSCSHLRSAHFKKVCQLPSLSVAIQAYNNKRLITIYGCIGETVEAYIQHKSSAYFYFHKISTLPDWIAITFQALAHGVHLACTCCCCME